MSDNEFIQDDHKPKNSIAGTSTSDDQATQIDGKKSGYLARFSQLFDRKNHPVKTLINLLSRWKRAIKNPQQSV